MVKVRFLKKVPLLHWNDDNKFCVNPQKWWQKPIFISFKTNLIQIKMFLLMQRNIWIKFFMFLLYLWEVLIWRIYSFPDGIIIRPFIICYFEGAFCHFFYSFYINEMPIWMNTPTVGQKLWKSQYRNKNWNHNWISCRPITLRN